MSKMTEGRFAVFLLRTGGEIAISAEQVIAIEQLPDRHCMLHVTDEIHTVTEDHSNDAYAAGTAVVVKGLVSEVAKKLVDAEEGL